MNDLDQQRDSFFSMLHEIFLLQKGFGAFAFISLADASDLFDQYLISGEKDDLFIKRYVNSINK